MSAKQGPIIETYRYQLQASGNISAIVSWVNEDGSIGEKHMISTIKGGGDFIDIPCARWGAFNWREYGYPKRGNEVGILLDLSEPIPPQYKGSIAIPAGLNLTRVGPCNIFNNFSFFFNGFNSNNYATIFDSDNLSFGNGTTDSPFSFSTWVNMTDATNFPILCKYISTEEEWTLLVDGNDKVRIVLYDNSAGPNATIGREWSTPVTSYEGQWAHVAVTYDGTGIGGLKIYWDTVRVDDTDIVNGSYVAMENTGADINIARFTGVSTELAEGYFDEVAIFNSELSQVNIDSIYNLGKPNDLTSLNPLSWWRMGDGASLASFGQWTMPDLGSGNNFAYLPSSVSRSFDVPQ